MPAEFLALVQINLSDRRLSLACKRDLDDFFHSLIRIYILERGNLLLEHDIIVNCVIFSLTLIDLKHTLEVHLGLKGLLDVVVLAQTEHFFTLTSVSILTIIQKAAHGRLVISQGGHVLPHGRERRLVPITVFICLRLFNFFSDLPKIIQLTRWHLFQSHASLLDSLRLSLSLMLFFTIDLFVCELLLNDDLDLGQVSNGIRTDDGVLI